MTDPGPAASYFVAAQTHSAVVLLVGELAYKFKKPVDLGFLDFSTLERRRAACEREVELNRRIAPDVYLGVGEVRDPDGRVCEHLVVMRRMPAQARLSALIRAGVPVEDDVRRVARQVAVFHAAAPTDDQISAEGSRDAIRRRWTDSFHQVRGLRTSVIPERQLDEIESLTFAFLVGREALFAARIAQGRVVDGHGDLLADDIYCLPDAPRILDCIEFDDRLRWLDQLDDAAFLAMDLEYLGEAELSRRYLDWYLEFAADPAPVALRHHFLAYRAFVRCKVSCLRFAQGDEAARADAVRHADLTVAHLRAGAVTLTLVGGLPGTGKSTLSAALADRTGAVLISTDRVRKELASLSPEDSARAAYREGIYSPEWTQRTYDTLLHRAAELIGLGESVVLDASWLSERQRQRGRELAAHTGTKMVELCCAAPAEVTAARLRRRTRSVSDADEAIARAMAADMEAWPQATIIRTDRPAGLSVEDAARAVAFDGVDEPFR